MEGGRYYGNNWIGAVMSITLGNRFRLERGMVGGMSFSG